MSNPLINPDLAPTTPAQRTWSLWHIAALWIGMSVCITTYTLAASMIDAGMSWWQAVLTVLLGNLIVLVPMILNGHPGTKYGIPFPVLLRASFGTGGANIAAMARAIVACGWFGIQTWIGGWAIYQLCGALGWIDISSDAAQTNELPLLGISLWQLACFFAFWLLNLVVILRGIESIKWLEAWSAPFLIIVGIALLIWAFTKVERPADLFMHESKFKTPQEFWRVFIPSLTAMVGYWATLSLNIPDFTRYCRSQRDQALGQLLGLPTTMALFCFIGIIVTSATVIVFGEAIWDPVKLVAKIGNPATVVFAMFALTIATLTTNIAANVVSPANDFSNLWPRGISFKAGGIITCIIGVIIMPWYLYQDPHGYIFTWLIGYGALLGPIAGIMLCDYYFLRRTKLDVNALYDPNGIYAGVNWRALVTLAIALAPNLPGFYNAATQTKTFPQIFDAIYTQAWFIGVLIAIPLYFMLMAGRIQIVSETARDRT
ncbi:MAG: NCS1 family nucleobase:cation symporter-1 [Phycisphaerales bacterium]|nr:NCS1 family nucleobase:cation symporter-1 [Phycisphaerales bacterium]MCI0629042.1 NCS1 family nucleobase:cation symporter-1 [Phycisphaerales bacterium]MCI0677255.1 NCS1 family nucleobase:cation symporter-1 [Phycisphaerales bacterium]